MGPQHYLKAYGPSECLVYYLVIKTVFLSNVALQQLCASDVS